MANTEKFIDHVVNSEYAKASGVAISTLDAIRGTLHSEWRTAEDKLIEIARLMDEHIIPDASSQTIIQVWGDALIARETRKNA